MLSINSLMLRTETMPPWRNAASTTSAAPAKDPEWVAAARLRDFGAAALENDQRLVLLGGFTGDGQETFRLFEPFDKDSDNAGVWRLR